MYYSLSHVQFFVTPCIVAHWAPLSMEFPRKEYWSGLPFPTLGDLPDSGIEHGSPALRVDTLPPGPLGKSSTSKAQHKSPCLRVLPRILWALVLPPCTSTVPSMAAWPPPITTVCYLPDRGSSGSGPSRGRRPPPGVQAQHSAPCGIRPQSGMVLGPASLDAIR